MKRIRRLNGRLKRKGISPFQFLTKMLTGRIRRTRRFYATTLYPKMTAINWNKPRKNIP